MALGDANNFGRNGGNQKLFDPTFYSRIKIKNKDHLVMSFTYSKGLLKMILSEEKENFRTEDVIDITFSPTKAKLMLNELETFVAKMQSGEFIDPKEAVGVNTGVGETVSFIAAKVTGNRSDVPEHSLTVGKISSNGVIENSLEFTFNVDYDFSIHWKDIGTMELDKVNDQFMGIKTVMDVLREFANSSAGAIGASVWDTGRYEVNRISRKIDPIYEKLGIERRSNGGGDNFFTKAGTPAMNPPQQARSRNMDYDEIENLIAEEGED